jgi:hypothetical protein
MFPLLGHHQNPPPAPPLVPRADVVFSLQRAGADAVFSFQFPVAVGAGSVVVENRVAGGRRRPAVHISGPSEPSLPELTVLAPVVVAPLPAPVVLFEEDEEEEMLLAAHVLLMQ